MGSLCAGEVDVLVDVVELEGAAQASYLDGYQTWRIDRQKLPRTPDEVKMIMIDPKKANLALRWAVDEMERRYELISEASVRDIGS